MSDRTMEVLPLPRGCPTRRGLLRGTPIPNKCTLQDIDVTVEAFDDLIRELVVASALRQM